ncbi:MAG: hypothetical protein AAFV85_11885 [Cyanobacteria bacterium J06634_6]
MITGSMMTVATLSSDDRFDRIEQKLDILADTVGSVSTRVDTLSTRVDTLSTRVDTLSTEVERSNDKFDTYQKATQWVVQLAFTLIASATITVILSTVLNR